MVELANPCASIGGIVIGHFGACGIDAQASLARTGVHVVAAPINDRIAMLEEGGPSRASYPQRIGLRVKDKYLVSVLRACRKVKYRGLVDVVNDEGVCKELVVTASILIALNKNGV